MARRPGRPRPCRRVRHRRRALRRGPAPALHRRVVATARLARVLRGVRRRPAHRRGGRAHRTCSTRPRRWCCSPARPGRVQPQTLAWLARYRLRWDLLIMRDCGDYDAAREFKRGPSPICATYGFDLRLAFDDDRRNRRHVPATKASPASTSTAATTTDPRLAPRAPPGRCSVTAWRPPPCAPVASLGATSRRRSTCRGSCPTGRRRTMPARR